MKCSRNILCLIITVLFSGNLQDIEAQNESHFPLLYYYSSEQQAFVIEDVMGNHSIKLVDFELCDNCWITGSGWSPSGSWFTWGTELVPTSATPHDNEHIYVTNYDGTEILTLTSADQRSRNAQWSPQSDLLLYEVYNIGEFSPSQYVIFDASSNEQIWTWDINDELLTDITWTPFGDIVIYSTPRDLIHQATMTVYSLNTGLIYERTVRLDWQTDGAICKPIWSADNEIVYINFDNQIVIEDTEQQERSVIDIEHTFIVSGITSPNYRYLILYTSDECNPYLPTTSSVWTISIEDRLTIQLSNEALFIPSYSLRNSFSSWSPDSQYWNGIDVDSDSIYKHFVLDMDTYMPENVQDFPAPEYPFTEDNILGFWKSESELIYFTQQDNRTNISIYNTKDDFRNLIANLEGHINSPSLSPDGSKIAMGNFSECNGVCVIDLSDNTTSSITTQFSDIGISETAEEIIWHSSNLWYFITGVPIGSARSINIGSVNDGVARNISGRFLLNEISSFGWMPTTTSNRTKS